VVRNWTGEVDEREERNLRPKVGVHDRIFSSHLESILGPKEFGGLNEIVDFIKGKAVQ
jgi:hypothetical protein